jgi:phage I-like protein
MFEAQGNDLPIDYEHQTLGGRYASPTGQAPAAGWIKRLDAVEGEGLVAEVAWTKPALSQLASRQYRYLSPVVVVGKRDGRLVALHSAALTNKPAIARTHPIVNSGKKARVIPVADEEDSMQTAWQELRDRLELETSADDEAVLIAASQRIEALQGQLARRDAEETVALAMEAGKLTSAQKAWALELVLRDPEAFASWLKDAPVIIPHGQVAPPTEEMDGDRRGASLALGATREYRTSWLLQMLTSEEAYVADALREATAACAGTRP